MKSILVIDTPNSCSECRNMENNVRCIYKYWGKAQTQRHPQCPLQDTTELLEALNYIKIITKDKNKIKSYYKLYNALGGKQ